RIVNDPETDSMIRWSAPGESFLVTDIPELERMVLPKHYKHRQFSSFVRQLNMYGFSKVNRVTRGHSKSDDQSVFEFAHTSFLRGRPDLLESIKRKSPSSGGNARY
ncbi:HSF-type DNA-binding-domain-containing protein, partial [Blastocladiella britannica]